MSGSGFARLNTTLKSGVVKSVFRFYLEVGKCYNVNVVGWSVFDHSQWNFGPLDTDVLGNPISARSMMENQVNIHV